MAERRRECETVKNAWRRTKQHEAIISELSDDVVDIEYGNEAEEVEVEELNFDN